MAREFVGKEIMDLLVGAGWPELTYHDDSKDLICGGTEIVSCKNGEVTLTFLRRDIGTGLISPISRLEKVMFPIDFPMGEYLFLKENSGAYQLSRESQFRKIIDPTSKGFTNMKIVPDANWAGHRAKVLTIRVSQFKQAMEVADKIARQSKSYAQRLEKYLADVASIEFGKPPRRTVTSIDKGEMSFSIDRLNLPIKKSKADLTKYLNEADVTSLQALTEKMIRYKVFSSDFLIKLNDYFVKESLADILARGEKILNLSSPDMTTVLAKNTCKQLGYPMTLQMESLWQKYFEDYLLYLIFSYQEIFSKVELKDIDDAKKYPDFIGVNHYNGLDVIEIKTHLKNVLSWDESHHNYYFSAEASRAIIQTSNYMDAVMQERFRKLSDRKRITAAVGEENLYSPRGIIIISSKSKLTNRGPKGETLNRDFTKLRNSISNIQIVTFDEVLSMAKSYLSHFSDVASKS